MSEKPATSRKQFDPQLFAENDVRARYAARQHIQHVSGLLVRDNDDKYGPDLVVYKGWKPSHYVEVEVKRVWSGADFPWDSVQLPERKQKFITKGLEIEFWILNNECTHAVIIPESAVRSSIPIEIPTSMNVRGEKFYQIPIDQCILKSL